NWLWVRSHWARGEAGWMIGIIRDIHFQHEREQRSAEARQVAALLRDTAGVTIWRHDPRTGEFEFNPDFAAVAEGERREGAILGDGVLSRIHAKDAAAVEAAFDASQASGEPAQVDYREWTSRGGWRNIRSAWRGSRRLEEGGFELVGISEDVTSLVRARDSARRGEKAALAAAEAKGRFLSNMSHELRTPMNGVLGMLNLLLADSPTARRRKLIRQAIASAARLSDLLAEIVEFSDIESTQIQLAEEPLDACAEIRRAIAPFRREAKAKGLAFSFKPMKGIGWMRGDADRLRQMTGHLLANAVKFTSAGGIEVRLFVIGEGAGRRLRLEVTDTGQGVPLSARSRLFRQFSQADASRTRRHGGSGLGLAITRRVAQLMGGKVGYASVASKGSTFWFEVPARACEAPGRAADHLEGLRVLVVEDNPVNRMVASVILQGAGIEVVTSEDGAEGVAAVERADFDLVCMDIQMPVMDGVEATRRIRAMAPPKGRIPILAATANVLPDQLDLYRRTGVDAVVAKPISPERLIGEVARLTRAGATERAPRSVEAAA
ncbi:MAG: ATP-binding protein, partial [Caulobacteraceae bacterium]